MRSTVASPAPPRSTWRSVTRTNLLDVIDRLGAIIGAPLEREHVDNRPGDVPHSQADNTLLRSLFPDVEPVALDDGLRDTVSWMREFLADRDTVELTPDDGERRTPVSPGG